MKTFKHKGYDGHKGKSVEGYLLIIHPTLVDFVSFVVKSGIA